MGNTLIKNREEIDTKYKWNIEAMYPDEETWLRDLNYALDKSDEFVSFHGRLTENAKTLADAFLMRDDIWQKAERAFVYARMKQDEDNRNPKQQAMSDKINTALSEISSKMSFFTPELLEAGESTLLGYISDDDRLKRYEFVIKDTLREKSHVLSKEEENLLAQISQITDAPHSIFTMFNNADLNFGTIEDESGQKSQLTHGNFIKYMESQDRNVRKAAFEAVYNTYKSYINTIATTYAYSVKRGVITSKIRKYSSARERALSGGNIPERVYDNLIDVVNQYLPVLHRYTKLRKHILGVEELKMYDIYVPLVKLPERDIPYEEAIEIMLEGLAPLGEEYLSQVKKGVEERWIDVYENPGKTSGAYSFGSYDSYPYILLNYSNSLKDVFTIVHEMGHSMHSWYTRRNQPFTYGDHSIFTAEVASTVNESLLINHLLNKETDPEMQKYLINLYIEEFRTTLFRQTMFAEFERETHRYVEEGGSLTKEYMCNLYGSLNSKYFGDSIKDNELIQYEWSRIPHFYRAFYVYQYATGYSAATAISKKILTEGETARDNYIEFLKSGSSDYPVELLKIAGVNMAEKEPIVLAMETFKSLVDKFEELMTEQN